MPTLTFSNSYGWIRHPKVKNILVGVTYSKPRDKHGSLMSARYTILVVTDRASGLELEGAWFRLNYWVAPGSSPHATAIGMIDHVLQGHSYVRDGLGPLNDTVKGRLSRLLGYIHERPYGQSEDLIIGFTSTAKARIVSG